MYVILHSDFRDKGNDKLKTWLAFPICAYIILNNEGHTMSCFGQVGMLIHCFVKHDQSHA